MVLWHLRVWESRKARKAEIRHRSDRSLLFSLSAGRVEFPSHRNIRVKEQKSEEELGMVEVEVGLLYYYINLFFRLV